MKKIETSKIIKYLTENNIDFKINGKEKKEYFLASIFEIIGNRFYFHTGKSTPKLISNSLILS